MVKWLRAWFAAPPGLQLAPHAFVAPWAPGRIAIHARICAFQRQPDGSLPDASCAFPDQPSDESHAGARDAEASAAPSALERAQAHDLATALRRAADDHAPARFARLYQVLLAAPAGHPEQVLARLAQVNAHPARMATLARYLACQAPDVAAVRLAIALLGQYGNADDSELLMTLGLHETFTLACAVALCKLLPPERAQTAMWNLARRVHGWGRIYVVRRLATTRCPEIQQWLLREGYRNNRAHAYLALLCASGGQLLPALQSGVVDERLLIGAGDILVALLHGPDAPAAQMADYADGAAATLAWLECVQRQQVRHPRVAASVAALARIDEHGLAWSAPHLARVADLAAGLAADLAADQGAARPLRQLGAA